MNFISRVGREERLFNANFLFRLQLTIVLAVCIAFLAASVLAVVAIAVVFEFKFVTA